MDDAAFATSGQRYNLACFLARQAAEKALKAFLFDRGAENVWGHSVAELCNDAARLEPAFQALLDKAAPLDNYYLPTRYPDALPGGIPAKAFAAEDAALALSRARTVLEGVQRHLSRGGTECQGVPPGPSPAARQDSEDQTDPGRGKGDAPAQP